MPLFYTGCGVTCRKCMLDEHYQTKNTWEISKCLFNICVQSSNVRRHPFSKDFFIPQTTVINQTKTNFWRRIITCSTVKECAARGPVRNTAWHYSLFHQILGVAFFQFALKKLSPILFSDHFFIFPRHHWKVGEFFCVLAKLDHLACNKFSKVQLSLTPLPWNMNSITCQMV